MPVVEKTFKWQRTSKKENYRLWCFRVELLQRFKNFFVVLGENFKFRLLQVLAAKSREKDRKGINLLSF